MSRFLSLCSHVGVYCSVLLCHWGELFVPVPLKSLVTHRCKPLKTPLCDIQTNIRTDDFPRTSLTVSKKLHSGVEQMFLPVFKKPFFVLYLYHSSGKQLCRKTFCKPVWQHWLLPCAELPTDGISHINIDLTLVYFWLKLCHAGQMEPGRKSNRAKRLFRIEQLQQRVSETPRMTFNTRSIVSKLKQHYREMPSQSWVYHMFKKSKDARWNQ